MRHELKHQISPPEDLVLSGRLRRLFPHDRHAGADGSYRVTSLYLDTPYDAALREKLDGVDRREKFRLRYYGDDPAWLKLEKKFKVNGRRGSGCWRESWTSFWSGRSHCWPSCTTSCGGAFWPPGQRSATTGRPSCTPPETCASLWTGTSAPG